MKKQKDRAAAELAKRRWRGVSAEERERQARYAVGQREKKRKERKKAMRQEIVDAHLPTWLKVQLIKVSKGDRSDGQRSYLDVGWHLAFHHLDDFGADRDNLPDFDDEEALANPTKTLRRIFASEDHPRGELTDWIPIRRRREFLRGLLWGGGGNGLGDLYEHDKIYR